MKFFRYVFGILIIFIFGFFILGEIFLPADSPDLGYVCNELDTEWVRVNEDGSKTPIDYPCRLDAKSGELIVVETILPDSFAKDTSCLCFKSGKQDMMIYIDGSLRYSYSTRDTRLFGKTSAVVYVMVPISMDDCGKTLSLSVQTDSSYSGMLYTVYSGTRIGIWKNFIKQYGAEFVIAIITLVLGSVTIIGSIALRLIYKKEIELEFLGWGVFLAAVWVVVNSVFRQIIFPGISVVNDMAFIIITILPLPFMIYMNEVQKKRYKLMYYCTEIIIILNAIICFLMHVFGYMDFAYSIKHTSVLCIIVIACLILSILLDYFKGKVKEYKMVSFGILGAFIMAIVQIITYYQRTAVFSGAYIAIGLTFLLVFSVINTIKDILAMKKEKQDAIVASEAKGRFLANMSHEIRTPINAVLGMDDMILRESTEPAIRDYAMDIKNAGQSLLAIINDILDFSKIESGKLQLVPVEYDFSSTIHDIVNMISMKAKNKGLYLNLELDEKLPSTLYGDDVRIRQILINLLNNAVKYTTIGGATLSVSGETTDDTVCLHFSVSDTGIGIREEDIDKLFVEFERIEESRNRNIEGSGLGMNITVSLLDLMNSKLNVKSVYGKGSCFYFDLVQKVVNKEPIGDLGQRIKQQTLDYSFSSKLVAPSSRILIVDDNAMNRKVLRNLLKQTKLQIDEASSGFECLEMVKDTSYDVIFMDHMMPEMDGIETLNKLKELEINASKNAVIIALTANAVSGAKEMYLEAGFDDYLTKPIVYPKLENVLLGYIPKEKQISEASDITDNNSDASQADITGNANLDVDEEHKLQLMNSIPELNITYARIFNSDVGFLYSILQDFYKVIDNEADILENNYNIIKEHGIQNGSDMPEKMREALKNYRVKVHAMKSSSAMIGAMSLSGVARMLEYAAKEERISVILDVTSAFLDEWRSYKKILAPCIQINEDKKIPFENEIFLDYINLLEEKMNELDVDSADNIINLIEQYEYPSYLTKLMEKLSVAVTNLDCDTVCDCCAKLRNLL